ncbi:hypothetical protein OIDMADRAFT_184820 [Oidiodendron maius Zn]|uniref:Uncharacterized protein n=1 Tax=Oidiodendron maius (strain Zn) TaxID=913774 RepID=A0A0C3C2T0_OIDMZ|nr:hypothetical protein OIDMADRAFT_184820 [Oidiodendron maius Zn]
MEKEPAKRNGNTGFPEPLCRYRNTTLTHPDADTSSNATLEAHDVDLSRAVSRLIHVSTSKSKSNSFMQRDNFDANCEVH